MKSPKSIKPLKNAHTSNQKIGMGDYYGTGVRNPIGTIRESSMYSVGKNLKKPPRSLA